MRFQSKKEKIQLSDPLTEQHPKLLKYVNP
jgi:hypothetical protein